MKQEGHHHDCICVNCRTHELKCWPESFQALLEEKKTFEVRRNDRGFKEGDHLELREYILREGCYTGRRMLLFVSYCQPLPEPEGFVGMSVKVIGGTWEYDEAHLKPFPA